MAAPDSNAATPRTPRRSPGGIVTAETKTKGRSYGARFRAHGERRFEHLGYEADGYTAEQAERDLAYITEQVRRGEWTPPAAAEPEPEPVPGFHEFASQWLAGRDQEARARARDPEAQPNAGLHWALEIHLLPTFARKRLDQISIADVDRYRQAKVAEGRIGTTSINKTLTVLAAVLEQAREYGHIERNPAAGRRRKLPAVKPKRTSLDSAQSIEALLAAAGELDGEGRTAPFRRALLATLVFTGCRIGECLALRWRHIDLAGGRIFVPGTKTDAAERTQQMAPALRDELLAHAARRRSDSRDAFVFPTSTGRPLGPTNVRRRVLGPAVERANERLAEQGYDPLPHLTPHSLRRTCANLIVALGWDPARFMRFMGHTTAGFTLSVYAQAMDWSEGEGERLRALWEGSGDHFGALSGTSAAGEAIEGLAPSPAERPETAL